MQSPTLVAGALIVAGIIGLIIPVLPGLFLTVVGVFVWAYPQHSVTGWTIFAIAVALAVAGWWLQYHLPGRRLKQVGVPGYSQLAGIVLAIIGFFVVPVVGLFLGFVLGVYAAEQVRLRNPAAAWTSTKEALRAVLTSIGIELAAAILVAITWIVGLVITA